MNRPAAVALWVLAGLSTATVGSQPVPRALVLLAAWLALGRRRVAGRRLAPLALGLVGLGLGSALLNGLLSHTGATVLAALPSWVPLAGGPLTLEALAYGATISLSLTAAVSTTAALSMVVEPADLVDSLPGFLARTGVALGAALNLVPSLAGSVRSVHEAQRLRGWRPARGRGMVDLAVPVLLSTIETSMQLAESMEARGFGSGPRTPARRPTGDRPNLILGGGSLAVLAGLVGSHLAGLVGQWYPYPTIQAPSLAPAVLAPAIGLVVLALLVPPSPAGP